MEEGWGGYSLRGAKMRKQSFNPLPGEIVTTLRETNLWEEPFDDNPHAGIVTVVRKGSFGIVVSAQVNDRLVMFQHGFGWTNANNLIRIFA